MGPPDSPRFCFLPAPGGLPGLGNTGLEHGAGDTLDELSVLHRIETPHSLSHMRRLKGHVNGLWIEARVCGEGVWTLAERSMAVRCGTVYMCSVYTVCAR